MCIRARPWGGHRGYNGRGLRLGPLGGGRRGRGRRRHGLTAGVRLGGVRHRTVHRLLGRRLARLRLGGKGWQMTRWQVTAAINSGGETFYTQVGGKRAIIQVIDDRDDPYLRTVVDDQWTDDLLALPECAGSSIAPRQTAPARGRNTS